MKDVIVCDLDGTLANCEHRVHHVQRVDGNGLKKKPDWDAFYAGVKDDTVNEAVKKLLDNMLYFDELLDYKHELIFCSGRPERCRDDTSLWLRTKAGYRQDCYTLFMRKDGDFRADYIVKEEILNDPEQLGEYKDRILFVLDDRQQVVDMWRRNGLTCFQVAPGDF